MGAHTINLHQLLARHTGRRILWFIVVNIVAGLDTGLGRLLGRGLIANEVTEPVGDKSARRNSRSRRVGKEDTYSS